MTTRRTPAGASPLAFRRSRPGCRARAIASGRSRLGDRDRMIASGRSCPGYRVWAIASGRLRLGDSVREIEAGRSHPGELPPSTRCASPVVAVPRRGSFDGPAPPRLRLGRQRGVREARRSRSAGRRPRRRRGAGDIRAKGDEADGSAMMNVFAATVSRRRPRGPTKIGCTPQEVRST